MADRKQTLRLGFEGHLRKVDVTLPATEATPWDADSKLEIVGTEVPRLDGHLKVSGRAKYTFDVALPGMLWAAVLRSPHPAARIESIDVSKAEGQPGVKAVLAVAKPGDTLRFAGQDVAAVAAERPEQARDALALIEVRYTPLPFVVDTEGAMRDKAPRVHEAPITERRTEGDEPGKAKAGGMQGNVRALPPNERGNVDKALRESDVVHEATYVTQVQTHSALETHGVLVRWDGDQSMTVWASTQGIFSVRDEMAEVFGLAPSKVRVITEYLGGGFGAKFGASAPGSRLGFIAGELSRLARAPVKLMCDRHEEHVCTGNRPDSRQAVALGGRRGKLHAIDVVAHGTAGIGTGAGVGRNAFSLYTRCPNARVRAHDVFTNGGPGTAMRAPGHPQGAFALELALDELAAKMGVDPLKLRLDHDEHPLRSMQLRQGAERFGWDELRKRSAQLRSRNTRVRKGVGVASSLWGDFGRANAAVATCSVLRDGTIELKNGVQDIGGGIPTVIAQVGAEVFARPLSTIRVRYGDSDYGPSVGSGGSTTTSSVTPAVRNACEQARVALQELAAKQLKVPAGEVRWDGDGTAHGGGGSITFGQLCKKIDGEAIVATATRPATYGHEPMAFPGSKFYQIAGAQFAEVEVDTWTGVVRATRVLAVHDCGRVMNPLTLRSQINGGVIQGTSYALMEERVLDGDLGRMLNPNLESYKILGARDVPEIEVMLTEVHTGANNTGAVGIGEPATVPTAAAIACAVYDALGVPVRSLPITPAKVLEALGMIPGRPA
ncbi:xanthine dehydrogenase family protein molybdopterin-binding subunit [Paraliomyxa miuraensis]|uniref:xanthine dehydrogenase family protein molybdopterin-binding subunit n=1 Tax=Paraliomyxa miuraensis TaxID=376150 RepID=UPI002254BC0E|nr:xanthine dehydrogenase family protein molybdopterin-binding subunit [Paraliomyxa miuraensis]MCX4244923.1 xanthine dehydrogenase family protein molybdopterin-binding subunit [Paraliomyxa miuraensis]